jgi:hypothetical protein
MNYKLTEQQVNRLMALLDLLPITGHQSRAVMNEICYIIVNLPPEAEPEPTEQVEQPPE